MKTVILSASVMMLFVFFGITAPVFVAAEETTVQARMLTANVGNADFQNCGGLYYFKLCLTAWEKPIAENIAKLSPEIVSLQEVLDVKWCESMPPEKNKKKVCYKYKEKTELQQVRRILGPDYTIVCDPRSGFECIGIKKDFAAVEGCEAGKLCFESAAITQEVPAECDQKVAVIGVDIVVKGKKIRIVNGHPSAAETECRAEEVKRMLEGYGKTLPLADTSMPVLAMGDMNLDPYLGNPELPDIQVWRAHIWDGKPFYFLSGIAEKNPPYPTIAGRTYDQVFTNFAKGKCQTLGEAPGTERLDGVKSKQIILEANDHRAIFCNLELPLK